jgi:hypothetical protein
MKPVVPMSWVISALVAICLTPGLSRIPRRGAAPQPAMLAQDDGGAVAVPGSADAPTAPSADDDSDDQNGQAQNNGQTQDDSDAPPANVQQPPADDSGDDTSTQQQTGDSGDQDVAPAAPSSNDDN